MIIKPKSADQQATGLNAVFILIPTRSGLFSQGLKTTVKVLNPDMLCEEELKTLKQGLT